jgi:hypothetical protein
MQLKPTQISRVCQVQIAAWVGWFPFLYYSTTYVGQLYVLTDAGNLRWQAPNRLDDLFEKGDHAQLVGHRLVHQRAGSPRRRACDRQVGRGLLFQTSHQVDSELARHKSWSSTGMGTSPPTLRSAPDRRGKSALASSESSVLASAFLGATLAFSCIYIKERDPRGDEPVTDKCSTGMGTSPPTLRSAPDRHGKSALASFEST